MWGIREEGRNDRGKAHCTNTLARVSVGGKTLEEQAGGGHRQTSRGPRDLQNVYSKRGSKLLVSRFSEESKTPNWLRTPLDSGLEVRTSGR